MMTKLSQVITVCLLLTSSGLFAQQDNPAYRAQRQKINSLLDKRIAKYGQFEQSLSERTGIFGLKTKKDMQRSIDLLSDIVVTDNTILRETKILLDYKDFEKSEVETKASDSEERITAYMASITRLQKQNEKLKAEIEELEQKKNWLTWGLIAFGVLVVLMVARMIRRK